MAPIAPIIALASLALRASYSSAQPPLEMKLAKTIFLFFFQIVSKDFSEKRGLGFGAVSGTEWMSQKTSTYRTWKKFGSFTRHACGP